MAAARVQGIGGFTGGGNSLTLTWGATTTAGNLVVVGVYVSGGGSPTITSITDSAGNTYTATTSSPYNNGTVPFRVYQWYGLQTSGATTITATASGGGPGIFMSADEFSGNAASSPYDTDSSGNGTGTAAAASSFSPAATGEIIVASVGHAAFAASTAGTGYTMGAAAFRMDNEYKLSGGSSETAPMTISNSDWGEIVGAYKIAGGGGGGATLFRRSLTSRTGSRMVA